MLPPMFVTQKARLPVVETWAIPKPPLGFSSHARIVRSPNDQRFRVPVSHSLTWPQAVFVLPTA